MGVFLSVCNKFYYKTNRIVKGKFSWGEIREFWCYWLQSVDIWEFLGCYKFFKYCEGT